MLDRETGVFEVVSPSGWCARRSARRVSGGVAATLAAVLVGCGPHVPIPPDAKLATEYPFPGEEEAALRIVEIGRATLARDVPEPGRGVPRDAHVKSHGCVRGTFEVRDDVPEAMRHGLFGSAARYPVWVRYSNGLPKPLDDRGDNTRGMAIKVMDVPGPKLAPDERRTQDFLLVNYPVFLMGDPHEYVKFAEAVAADRPLSYFFGWNPFAWQVRLFLSLADAIGQETPSLLAARYWSETPYRLGAGQAAKWSARPCTPVAAEMPEDPSDSYLREDLAARLEREPACFDFLAQLQRDPVRQPIEDPTVEWLEEEAPFVPVARLSIPAQTFSSGAQEQFCENLSFSPWHALPEHQPLGAANRMRKRIYDEISKYRHGRNASPRVEPNGFERF